MSLKMKLLLIISILIIITVSVLQLMSVRLSGQALEEQKETELRSLVEKTAGAIDLSIDGARRALDAIAVSPELQAVLEQTAANGEEPLEPEALLQFFARFEESQEDIETVLFLDRRGIVVADDEYGNLVGMDLSDRGYFHGLTFGNQDYFLDEVIVSRTTGNRVIPYAKRLTGETGGFAGVVAVVLNFDTFIENFAAELAVGETGEATLIDSRGAIMYHTDPELVGENLLELATEEMREQLADMIRTGQATNGYFTEHGTEHIFFAEPVGNWYIILEMEETEYLAASIAIRNSGLLLGLLFILLGALAAFFFANRITSPIIKVSKVLHRAGKGDLTESIEVQSRDEVGRLAESVNTMISGQRNILQQVLAASQNVASHSEELSASVEESNASMQQVASTVDLEVSQKAQEIVHASADAVQRGQTMEQQASEGEIAVQDAVRSMEEISQATGEVHSVIHQLNNASEQIGSIVVTITDIAEQTNLLALNAAIEAARAGEQGRGFAVVAEEVRKLAEQSSSAAGEIGELIINIQTKTGNAVTKIADAGKIVEAGTSRASRAGERLEEIRSAAAEVKGQIERIVVQAEAQSASAQEIAAGTEEQTAVLEEISATSNQLAAMAEELNVIVANFKL
ncbi:methyl-accepting chemotaxis protein [Dethiobacter alkaliphilus]|uniref:methyl-accepting chemotaxis protein n=1 Tax=Dethiobacter alkaliphilus TaxID=427926 RepID=UPI0022262D1A|nr:methyl-accepting chemotaxis protein [Dethiobacter alkaliphilus]MCW3491252.1 methyl-accepting chemotaxis protein [Dethiobacter alkaliphilus]